MLARDGKLIADDGGKVTFEELGRYTDPEAGKPVGNVTRYTYTYTGGDQRAGQPSQSVTQSPLEAWRVRYPADSARLAASPVVHAEARRLTGIGLGAGLPRGVPRLVSRRRFLARGC